MGLNPPHTTQSENKLDFDHKGNIHSTYMNVTGCIYTVDIMVDISNLILSQQSCLFNSQCPQVRPCCWSLGGGVRPLWPVHIFFFALFLGILGYYHFGPLVFVYIHTVCPCLCLFYIVTYYKKQIKTSLHKKNFTISVG